jgi:hypothetical protein
VAGLALLAGCSSYDPRSLELVQHEIACLTTMSEVNAQVSLALGLKAHDVASVASFGAEVSKHVDDLVHGRTIHVRGKPLPRREVPVKGRDRNQPCEHGRKRKKCPLDHVEPVHAVLIRPLTDLEIQLAHMDEEEQLPPLEDGELP